MLKCDLNFDYSECSGTGFEFDSLSDTLKIAIGDGITNTSFTLSDEQARELVEALITQVYGEKTLEELEEKVLELDAKNEELENKVEQYEELFYTRR